MATLMLPPSPSLFGTSKTSSEVGENDSIPDLELTAKADDEDAWKPNVVEEEPALSMSPQIVNLAQLSSTSDEKGETLSSCAVLPPLCETMDKEFTEPLINSQEKTDALQITDDESSKSINSTSALELHQAENLSKETGESNNIVLPGGIWNLGNTCYMASALQMLCSLEPLMNLLVAELREKNGGEHELESTKYDLETIVDGITDSPAEASTAKEFATVLASFVDVYLRLRSGETVEPRALKQVLDQRSSLFIGYQQQDSHEFITTILDFLDEDFKKQMAGRVTNDHDEESKAKKKTVKGLDEDVLESCGDSEQICEEPCNLRGASEDTGLPIEAETSAVSASEQIIQTSVVITKSNKRLKTTDSLAFDEDSTAQESQSCPIASSFSELNVDEIGHLLRGTPTAGEGEEMLLTQPASHPKCKLVGGRMSLELRHDSVVAATESNNLQESLVESPSSENLATNQSVLSTDAGTSDEAMEGQGQVTVKQPGQCQEPRSPVDEYMTTEVRIRLTCDSCKYTRTHHEKFWHLSLELDGENDPTSVSDGLARFFAPERRELKCEKCFCETSTQTMQITRLPRALLLHLKRFIVEVSADYTSVSYRKNVSPVSFGTAMTVLEPSLESESELHSDEPSSILSEFLAPDCVIPKTKQQEAQLLCCQPCAPTKYKLTSVVNHIGSSASCGHYTADAQRNNEWLRFNDSSVSSISEHDATEGSSSTAYMIMYELK